MNPPLLYSYVTKGLELDKYTLTNFSLQIVSYLQCSPSIPQKCADKLILLQCAICSFLAGYLIEGLNSIGLHARAIDKEGNRLSGMGAVRTRCRMVGEDGNGNGFGHGAKFVQQRLLHPQYTSLYAVGVADHTAAKYVTGAGQIGHALGDEAAGAALGGGEGHVPLPQQGGDHLLQRVHIHAVDHISQGFLHLGDEGFEHLLRFFGGGSLGGGADHALVGLGVGSQGGVGEGGHGLVESLLHSALTHTEDADLVADDDAVHQLAQIGDGAVFKHIAALKGRTGEHQHMGAFLLDGAAGCGAHRIGENGAALGQHGLLEVVSRPDVDVVLNSVVGMAGLKPTLTAIEANKKIALANKETLVTAGHLIMPLAKEHGVHILPVDSEHSAIYQCLRGEEMRAIDKLIITASGGPFRGRTTEDLEKVTLEEGQEFSLLKQKSKIHI